MCIKRNRLLAGADRSLCFIRRLLSSQGAKGINGGRCLPVCWKVATWRNHCPPSGQSGSSSHVGWSGSFGVHPLGCPRPWRPVYEQGRHVYRTGVLRMVQPRRGDMFIEPTNQTNASPVRGDMFIERACCGWSSPVGAACSIASRFAARTMPPLRSWTIVLRWFYKHAIPTGLDMSFGRWLHEHAAPPGLTPIPQPLLQTCRPYGADADSATAATNMPPLRG